MTGLVKHTDDTNVLLWWAATWVTPKTTTLKSDQSEKDRANDAFVMIYDQLAKK